MSSLEFTREQLIKHLITTWFCIWREWGKNYVVQNKSASLYCLKKNPGSACNVASNVGPNLHVPPFPTKVLGWTTTTTRAPYLRRTAWSEWGAPTARSGYVFPSRSTEPDNEKPNPRINSRIAEPRITCNIYILYIYNISIALGTDIYPIHKSEKMFTKIEPIIVI